MKRAIYFAGLLDWEGSFYLSEKKQRKNFIIVPVISIGQLPTDFKQLLIEWISFGAIFQRELYLAGFGTLISLARQMLFNFLIMIHVRTSGFVWRVAF